MRSNAVMSYRGFGPGWCNTCQQFIYYPQNQRPGFEGCQCTTPDLETWQQWDEESERHYQEVLAARAAAHAASPITRPDSFSVWKKQAKRL
jgi:hypothetical protein